MTTPDKITTLTRIRVPLKTGEFDEREFHAMPSLLRFLQEILPGAKAGVLGATESPAAQMDRFCESGMLGNRWLIAGRFPISNPPAAAFGK
jgi:hypothetical protein